MFHNDRVIFITHLYNRTNFKIKAKLCVDKNNICSKLIVFFGILWSLSTNDGKLYFLSSLCRGYIVSYVFTNNVIASVAA